MFDLHEGKKRVATVSFTKTLLDGTVVPGVVQGVPVWVSSDSAVMSVTPSADGLTADLGWVSAGTADVTVTADGDLGEAIFPIVLTDTGNMVASLGATDGILAVSDEVVV